MPRKLVLVILIAGLSSLARFAPAQAAESKEAIVERKLRASIIPEVNFRDASIQDVVAFLVQSSRELDSEKLGVNIILNLGTGAANTATDASLFGGKASPTAGTAAACMPASPRTSGVAIRSMRPADPRRPNSCERTLPRSLSSSGASVHAPLRSRLSIGSSRSPKGSRRQSSEREVAL